MKPFAIFYHVAALNDWKPIVVEQLNLLSVSGALAACGRFVVTLNGKESDRVWLLRAISKCNAQVDTWVKLSELPMQMGETFAIQEIEKYAHENPTHAVCYLHTKGVSRKPGDYSQSTKDNWRWVMGESVIAKWKNNLKQLETKVVAGWNWYDRQSVVSLAFPGNFWFVNCEYLRNLPSFSDFQAKFKATEVSNHKHPRYACEQWIGLNLKAGSPLVYSVERRNEDINKFLHKLSFPKQRAALKTLMKTKDENALLDAIEPTEAELQTASLSAFANQLQTVIETEAPTEDQPKGKKKKTETPVETEPVKTEAEVTDWLAKFDALFYESGSDKGFYRKDAKGQKQNGHDYGELYAGLFNPADVKDLLEIGVQFGHSLRCWKELYPNARLVGIDKEKVQVDGADVYIFDVANPTALKNFAANAGQFDLIIDDGSHRNDHIQLAFAQLWPLLRPGGWYVIEDYHTSFAKWRSAYHNARFKSTQDWLRALVNTLHQNGAEFNDGSSPYVEIRERKSIVAIKKA